MAQAVKISDVEYEAIREAAVINSRSLSGQAEHWIRIGRAVERDPGIAYSRIEQALRGLMPVDDLTGDEQDEFFELFSEKMATPSAEEKAFYANLGKGAVGDDDDALVYSGDSK